jgi:hypothetical protein
MAKALTCVEVLLVLTSLGLPAVPLGFLFVPLIECPYSVFKYVTTFSDRVLASGISKPYSHITQRLIAWNINSFIHSFIHSLIL